MQSLLKTAKLSLLTKKMLGFPRSNWFFTNREKRYADYDIGDWTYGAPTVVRWGTHTRLKIGKFCSIADGVTILLGGEHRTDWISTYPFNKFLDLAQTVEGHPGTKGDVVIQNDVWIGANTTILSGVTIHNGAVVGAGSLVCKDVPPYAVVAGNPARQIRLRFAENLVAELVKIAWWDWPIEKIRVAVPLLLSDGVESFIARYK